VVLSDFTDGSFWLFRGLFQSSSRCSRADGIHAVGEREVYPRRGSFWLKKASPFFMSEHSHPPLLSSLPGFIISLSDQFSALTMSTENSIVPEALQGAAPNTVAPLSVASRAELLKFFKDFEKDLSESKNPGFFNLHCECLDEAIMVRFRHFLLYLYVLTVLYLQTWRTLNQRDLAGLEHEFVENVDLQNALFAVNRKYHELAYGERKLLPPIWTDKPDRKPKIVDFIVETSGKIKAFHLAKKRQQSIAPVVLVEVPGEVSPEAVKSKNKVLLFLLSFVFLLTLNSVQGTDFVSENQASRS
jgi:hypothetical protein